MSEAQWLLLAHQLPTRSSNARVRTWRRLQQIGAVAVRNSVYALPNTAACREDFEWMRSEITALGGSATVFAADALSEDGTEDVVASFQRSRTQGYETLKRDAERLLTAIRGKRSRGPSRSRRLSRAVRALKDRFGALEQIDFYNATARDETAAAIATLDRVMNKERTPPPRPSNEQAPDFRRRRWVTRARPGVDRMASAWLIRRFIDPHATFAFVDNPDGSDVPFDMYTGDFSHRGGQCTFEVLAERFGVTNPAVAPIGRIVHDLDMKETKYAPPEAPAVGRMVDGLRAIHSDDAVLLEHGITMFEALARSFESTNAELPAESKPRAGSRRPTRRKRT